MHPLRADLPIWLGAEGPNNVALAAEIADGWLPIYFSPRVGDMYTVLAGRGLRPSQGPGAGPSTFEIATNCQVVVTDDRRRRPRLP